MQEQRRPNVLILHTDQQRYDSLGCTGNPHAVTPHLDRLAEDGMLFTRHISAHPVCMPSRASLLTGLSLLAHGVSTNGIPLWRLAEDDVPAPCNRIYEKMFGKPFPRSIPTLADMLQEAGYATACLGKMHLQPHMAHARFGFQDNYAWQSLPENADWQGPFYGFQTCRLTLGHGERPCHLDGGHYARWLHAQHPEIARDVMAGKGRTQKPGVAGDIYLSPLPSELHNSSWLADEACRVIDAAQDPFFLFVGFPDPHHSWTPPVDVGREFEDGPYPAFTPLAAALRGKPDAIRRSLQRNHAPEADCIQAYRHTNAMLHLIDRAVGRIVERLKHQGLYDDTIIVFTSDHGDFLGDYHCLRKDDLPYRCLLHVPFILKTADTDAAGRRIDTPMSGIDVVPTLLGLLGLDAPARLQGSNVFVGPSSDRRAFVSTHKDGTGGAAMTIFDDRFRYTLFPHTGEEELYDHEDDPRELCNLAGQTAYNSTIKARREEVLLTHARLQTPSFFRYSPW
jgi:arylsulfatase A-like enzyme